MADRQELRIGSIAAFVGTALALVANGGHPRFSVDELNDNPAVFLERIEAYEPWLLVHFLAIVGIVIFLATFSALTRSVGLGGETWGRLAWASAIVGVAVGVVSLLIDGFALGAMASELSGAAGPEEAALVAVATGVEAISSAAFGTWQLILLGSTPLLYGLAIRAGDGYPRYLGWVAVLAGLAGLTSGVIQLFAGFTVVGFLVLFLVASLLVTVWVLIIGWHQWVKSRQALPVQ